MLFRSARKGGGEQDDGAIERSKPSQQALNDGGHIDVVGVDLVDDDDFAGEAQEAKREKAGAQSGHHGLIDRARTEWREEAAAAALKPRSGDNGAVGAIVAEAAYPSLGDQLAEAVPELGLFLGLGALLGLVGTWLVARMVRRSTRGLGTTELAHLADHREALLHAIREGVVGVGTDGRVTAMNDAARATLGLDRPFIVRFSEWLWNVLNGDLGVSIFTNLPVAHMIKQRLEPTFSLMVLTLTFAISFAVPMGVVAA